jgi:hypothetical protein
MPVDWEKVERLRVERFGDARFGQPGARGFAAATGLSYEQYRYHFEAARKGRRADPQITRGGGIALSYVERIAAALDVPLAEILDGQTRSEEYERGVHNGRLQALAEMHQLLNDLMREGQP